MSKLPKIEVDAQALLGDAAATAEYYMDKAIARIDKHFGDGYAMKHPDLVVGFMHAATVDFAGAMVLAGAQHISEAIREVAMNLRRDD